MATYNIEDIGGKIKARYYKKLKDVDLGCCPCKIPSDASKNNLSKWPDLEFPDMHVYLIDTTGAFTIESTKKGKTL